MTTRPADPPYQWGTNSGVRTEPTAVEKGTGAVPGNPMGSGVFNDLVGRLSDWVAYLAGLAVPSIALRTFYDLTADALVGKLVEVTSDGTGIAGGVGVHAARQEPSTTTAPAAEEGYREVYCVLDEQTTGNLSVFCVDPRSRSVRTSYTVVASGTCVGIVGDAATADAVILYKLSGVMYCKSFDGATLGSQVKVWDPTDEDASDAFSGTASAVRLTRGDNAGRIIVVSGYNDNSGTVDIRFVFSDDDGATWDDNGGAGYSIYTGGTVVTEPTCVQADDGTIWTFAMDSGNDDVYYQQGTTALPTPTSTTATTKIIDTTGATHYLYGGLGAGGGLVLLMNVAGDVQAVPVAIEGGVPVIQGYDPVLITGGATGSGAICRDAGGGLYLLARSFESSTFYFDLFAADLVLRRQPGA